ncbi:unnamed protein product [Cunninghamella blakesleeana]
MSVKVKNSEKRKYYPSSIKEKEPTQDYLKICKEQVSNTLEEPISKEKQLLILDLNGTLVSRAGRNPTTSLFVRPYDKEFFDYIFSHFYVIVWSSAQPHNVKKMCKIFGKYEDKLQLIWTRDHFGLTTKESQSKIITIKDLRKIWQHLPQFNATNTVLIDDSPKKTILQPYNHIIIAEFDHHDQTFKNQGENELFYVKDYLGKLKYQDNISNYIFQHPYQSPLLLQTDDDLKNYSKSTVCLHYIYNNNDKNDIDPPTKHDFGIKNINKSNDIEQLTSQIDKIKL